MLDHSPIPVLRIGEIQFAAVQDGMPVATFCCFNLLADRVRLVEMIEP